MVFDLLRVDGADLTRAPYAERRAQLEALDLNGVYWQTPDTFDDGDALFEAVCGMSWRVSSRRSVASGTAPASAAG